MSGINLKKNVQSDGVTRVAIAHRRGSEAIYATHNLCDATTWYSESLRLTEKTLTKNGAFYESGDVFWVDLTHGKVFDEEGLIALQKVFEPSAPHGYEVVIETSDDGGTTWVTRPMRAPFATTGGDYTVDYAAGTITFVANDPAPADLVRGSYSQMTNSAWVLTPKSGTSLAVTKSELQFSSDVDFKDTIVMEVYGLADYFAPHLLDTADPPGPLPPGTPIPIETTYYKTMHQFIDESVGFFPALPPIGGLTRGSQKNTYVLQFHYDVAKVMYSSLGMYLRISLEGDNAFLGERATGTFYLFSGADPGAAKALGELTG